MGRHLALLSLVVNSMDQIHFKRAMSGDTTQGLTLAGALGLLTADQAEHRGLPQGQHSAPWPRAATAPSHPYGKAKTAKTARAEVWWNMSQVLLGCQVSVSLNWASVHYSHRILMMWQSLCSHQTVLRAKNAPGNYGSAEKGKMREAYDKNQ